MALRENRTGVFEIPQDPALADLFRVSLRNLRLQIRTHSVATVISYNATTQKVTVTVDALQVFKNNAIPGTAQKPNPESVQKPVTLTNIPVTWPRTNAGYLTFPLVPGDTGELHVQDRTLQQWLQIGRATDPVAAFTHSLADSVFYPGLHFDGAPIVPPTDLTGTVLDGDALIKIGRLATEAIAKADTLISVMDLAWAAATPVPTDGGANLKATWLVAWNAAKNTIKAVKGRVE